jgi:hypothetical protein
MIFKLLLNNLSEGEPDGNDPAAHARGCRAQSRLRESRHIRGSERLVEQPHRRARWRRLDHEGVVPRRADHL